MYNKSEIMKKAWTLYKSTTIKTWKEFRNGKFVKVTYTFAMALKEAWEIAKRKAAAAKLNQKPVTVQEQIAKIEKSLFNLNMKDLWSSDDYEQDSIWRNELNKLNEQLKGIKAAA